MTLLPKDEKSYLTFLFSDTNVKIAEVLDKKGKKILGKFFEAPLPPDLIIESEVKDFDKLSKFLNDLKPKLGIENNDVIIGVLETKASLHTLTLPNLSPEEVNQAIKYQAESFLPFPYQNEYLDWKYQGDRYEKNIKILINAIPKNIVDGYINTFNNIGLKPLAFESTGLSLLRLVAPVHRKSILIAELAENLMTVIVVNKEGDIETSSVVSDKSQYLPTLKKINDYYFQANKEAGEPSVIYICGKGVSNDRLEQIKKLDLKPVALKADVEGVTPGRESELAVLLSMAQKKVNLPQDPNSINILPTAIAQQYELLTLESKNKKWNLLLSFFLLITNLIVFTIYIQNKIKTYSSSATTSSKNLINVQDLDNYREKINLLNQTTSQNETLKKAVKEIWQASNSSVQITGFVYSDEKKEIDLTGKATLKDDLLHYKEILEKTGLFTKISIPLPYLKEEANVAFRIILKL